MTLPLSTWLRRQGIEQSFSVLANLYPQAVVFVVDADRNLLFWNQEAERQLGFAAKDLLGSHCLKGIRCADCMATCGFLNEPKWADRPVLLHRSDGSTAAFRRYAQAFFDGEEGFAGGIEILVPETDAPAPPPGEDTEDFHGLVSRDPAMHQVFQVIRNVAETEASVLIRGESGTGKELVARAIHQESHRAKGPFVALNCAALSPTLLESELFGHVRGAFTGAVSDRIGYFAQADKGTLFLDEVAELPMEMQSKLLRVLQERSFLPVGGQKMQQVNVRVLSATHKALRAEVKAGRFREDLMFRLRVVPLFLPPLRERRGDIELLLQQFIARNNQRGPRRVRTVAPEAMRALLDHLWPGNVRELQNVVDYAFAVGRGPEIGLSELPPEFRENSTSTRKLPEGEAERVKMALAAKEGHVGRAAARLGISRPTFWRLRKKYGI